MNKKLFLVTLLLLCCQWAQGYEFYTFVDRQCHAYTGLVIHVGEEQVAIWQLNGEFKTFSREKIDRVFIFNTSDNPFPRVPKSQAAISLLKKVFTRNRSKKPLLIGWPYKFVEELVFFFDIKGKIYILDLNQIKLIEEVKKNEKLRFVLSKKKPVHLDLGRYLSRCFDQKSERRPHSLAPDRVIGDKIKIFEFFKNLENGFNQIDDFQERTWVYGRPFLFERRPRLGILAFNGVREYSPFDIPFYYQWSNGRDLHFQSQSVIGGSFVKWLPNVEPTFVVMSDVKSHFFNATFVGNLFALSAGSDVTDGERLENKEDASNKIQVTPQFNYLSMMGADWRFLSLSAGPYFATYILKIDDEVREVLATKNSPVFRLQLIWDDLILRMIFSSSRYTHSDVLVGKHFVGSGDLYKDHSSNFKSLSFKSRFLRLGFDYNISQDTTLGVDEVFMKGEYTEEVASFNNHLDFQHLYTSAYVQRQFGHYVFLKLVGNYYMYKYDYRMGDQSGNVDDTLFSLGGIFGLLF